MFLAMLLLFVSFLAFSSDMDNYVKLQAHLKALAEECACGSSLFTEEAEYAEGRVVIDESAAESYIGFMLRQAERSMPQFSGASLSAEFTFYDDVKGYDGALDYGLAVGRPGAVVTITYTGKDLFRLPFFTLKTLERTAAYQWEE